VDAIALRRDGVHGNGASVSWNPTEGDIKLRAQIKLGRILGIELGLHYSWLIIATLITFSLAAHFRAVNANWSIAVTWGAAVITSVLFFACLFAHELSHAVVARSRNIPVRRITLFALGGVAQIEKEASDAKTEFWIAIAGPITSGVLGLVLLWIASVIGWSPYTNPATPVLAVLVWLGYINIALGIFNMIPGFPLDGGRVLRAVVWWATGNAARAMRTAVRMGQFVGMAMMVYGIFRFFNGAGFGGLWLSFIGWFLLEAAGVSYLQFEATTLLEDLRAKDLMSHDCTSLDGEMSVQQFVDEHLLRTAQRCFVVVEGGRMAGLVTPQEVRTVERSRWPGTHVREVMQPLEKVRSVAPETPVLKAMEVMAREDLNQVPVVSSNHVEGMISRSSILQVLQSRAELKAS
jgi:Zn-dependent protease/predicted transcriptional regulator